MHRSKSGLSCPVMGWSGRGACGSFVGFSDDRRFFMPALVLFVLFVLVIIVVGVSWRHRVAPASLIWECRLKRLVAGVSGYICDQRVTKCVAVLEQHGGFAPTVPSRWSKAG